MSTLMTRMFSRPRALCADCQEGQGRNCACHKRREPIPTTAGSFWWAYALVLVAVLALVRAFA